VYIVRVALGIIEAGEDSVLCVLSVAGGHVVWIAGAYKTALTTVLRTLLPGP